jgi:glycosyltransferase involved in cell wall biosynthesis
MKSICLDARKLEIGGIGTYLQNILKNFPFSHFDLTLLAPSSSTFDLKSFRVIPCDIPDYSIQEQMKLPFVIPKCDLFWTPHFNIPLFPIRARKRLITLPDIFHLAHSTGLKFLEKMYAKLFIPKAIRKSDHVITVSKFSERELFRLTSISQEKITVIPNGVDQELFKPCLSPQRHEEVKKKYHLPEHYYLFIGNQKAHKNLKRVLQGFAHFFSKTQTESYLLIVGSGIGLRHVEDLQQLLRDFSELKNRVITLGHVKKSDLPLLYQRSVALVFPSLYEGFGLPPLEAMSSACPVITSRVASLEEVCKDAVYYVDPLKPHSIARGMEVLWKDSAVRQSLIEKGQQHVKTFLWETAIEKHFELIRELLA